MTALRELAERWKEQSEWNSVGRAKIQCAAELLSILDAEGDGGAVGEAVDCPECGARCQHTSCVLDSGDEIHNYQATDSSLREPIRRMAEMLENNEWANLLSDDADISRLDVAIGNSIATHPARSGVVRDGDVEAACGVFLDNVTDHQKDIEVDMVAMRAALEHFAKGERHER